MSNFYNIFFTYWISNEFFKTGENILIRYPLYLKGGKYIRLGDNVEIDRGFKLEAWSEYLNQKFKPEIYIGNNVSIQKDCHIGAINKIIIGDNVLIASRVFITDHSHGEINGNSSLVPPKSRELFSKGPVIVKKNVWIGEGVVILPGVTIGENSIIGANTVVTRSIPKNSIIVGNPARIIKSLTNEES